MRENGGVKRLLSGIRPSGALHLGQYVGVLEWLAYQDEYDCFFVIADVQALTTHRGRPDAIRDSVREVVLDWLSIGLHPGKSSFVLQSQIPEFAELTVYLQQFAQTGELRRNPTMRAEARWLGKGDLSESDDEIEFGFLGYPVAQVADILLFTPNPPHEADRLIVPVGEDQVPHVEFACRIARRFNTTYGTTFLEPEAKTAEVALLPGLDGGSKMGASLRNAILLSDPEEEYAKKIRTMVTDPLRVSAEDPGHPEQCPCFLFRKAFGRDPDAVRQRAEDCLLAVTDCSDCREDLLSEVRAFLGPIQAKRAELERQPDYVADALTDGTARAREVARTTLERVREVMRLSYPDLLRGGS